jgi:hypothetical protein
VGSSTPLPLREGRGGSFIEELRGSLADGSRYPISPLGRRHYELHHACYRELHPDVGAAEPADTSTGAYSGLVGHQVRRPKHLVRATDLPILSTLTRWEAMDFSGWRNIVIEQYGQLNAAIPEHVRAIPPGLTRWQARDTTRSEKSVDRLLAHPGGPLIDVIDVPNQPGNIEHPTIELIVLTQVGRDHYARHVAEYRQATPN